MVNVVYHVHFTLIEITLEAYEKKFTKKLSRFINGFELISDVSTI